MESVISASMVVLVIRTRKPLFKSKPRMHLLLVTLFIASLTISLPFTPLASLFGFRELSVLYLSVIAMIVLIIYYYSRDSKENILQKRKTLAK